jgi:hypothetical protein
MAVPRFSAKLQQNPVAHAIHGYQENVLTFRFYRQPLRGSDRKTLVIKRKYPEYPTTNDVQEDSLILTCILSLPKEPGMLLKNKIR